MNKSRKAGLFLSYGYFVINTIISIFMSSFVLRMIGKTDYGVYQSVTAFVTYLTLLEFGTGRIISRNISLLKKDGTDDDDVKKNISTVLVLNCALTVVILCCAVVFWLFLDIIYQRSMSSDQLKMAKILFLFPIGSLIVTFFQQMLNGILIGFENYTYEKILSFVKLIFRTSVVIAALMIKKSIYLYVAIDLGINVIALLITFIYIISRIKVSFSLFYFDKTIFKLITPLCLAMLLQSVVSTMNGTLDKFLISIMMTPEDVTVYSIAMTIFSMYSTIGCLPVNIFLPQVATNMKNGAEGLELTKTLVQPVRLNVLITGIIGFGFALVGRQFVTILYGSDYMDAWLFAIIIIIPTFFNTANDIILNVLDVLRKRHIRSLILMITTALNLVLTILGIKYIGMLGAALATSIATILQVIILNIYYYKKIKIHVMYLFREGFKGILLPLSISFACSLPLFFLIDNVYVSFVICGFAYIVIFGILFCLFGRNEYEKKYIDKIMNKFSHK